MIGEWRVDPAGGSLVRGGELRRLEPRVMSLLVFLATEAKAPISREALEQRVWGDTVVGEDAVPRAILKLRRALDDDARNPRYLETLPRRGYRLLHTPRTVDPPQRIPRWIWSAGIALAAAGALWSVTGLRTANDSSAQLERAHDYYHQFSREGNEAAAALYQTLIDANPENAAALAGRANALVQRVVRWPSGQATVVRERQSVTEALGSERLQTPWARSTLTEAHRLAARAIELDPRNPEAHKALGLVRSLLGDRTGARQAYENALELKPDLWSALVNLAELEIQEDRRRQAIGHFEAAWNAMQSDYVDSPQRIGSWLAELGVLLGELHKAEGKPEQAEKWFRRVLETQPWHGDATLGLAHLLRERGETREAESLCGELALRIGPEKRCEPIQSRP